MTTKTTNAGPEEAVGTEERLLREAARLFREQGYTKTSTRQLAKAVGLQSASLYHYMTTKEDLLETICTRGYVLLIDSMKEATKDANSKDIVERVIKVHLHGAIANRDVHLTTLAEVKFLSPEARKKVNSLRSEYSDILVAFMTQAQNDGYLRTDISAKDLVLVLRNQVSWPLFWFKESGPLNIDDLASLIYRVFIEGAGPRQ